MRQWNLNIVALTGNEYPDEEARQGAEGHTMGPEPILGITEQSNVSQEHAKAVITGYSRKFSSRVMNLYPKESRLLTRTLLIYHRFRCEEEDARTYTL